ncbi:ABC transporter permease [Candidatus Acetothermia bacterium]|nr:ABC transporter permease [Candidatus Acetothermia bacterium]MBI3643703.1 ABC transporter permease [Candidatus Acetothermia bacterium]
MWFQIALRSLARNRRRTILTLAVIALGTAMSFAVAGYIDDALNKLRSETVKQYGNLQIANASLWKDSLAGYQSMITPAVYAKVQEILQKYPAVASYTPEIMLSGIATTGSSSKGLHAIAFDPINTALNYNDIVVDGDRVQSKSTNILVGESLSKEFDLKLGQRIDLTASTVGGQHNRIRLKVTGIFRRNDQKDESQLIFVPLSAAQQLIQTNNYSKVAVTLDKLEDTEPTAAALQADFDATRLCNTESYNVLVGTSTTTPADNHTIITDDNKPVTTNILQSHSKENLDAASIRIAHGASNGSLSVNNSTGEVTYNPKTDFVGSDSFEVEACTKTGLGLQVKSWKQLSVYYQQVEGFFMALFGFLTITVALLVFFIVFQVLTMSFLERTREVGTIRAIGTKRQQVFAMFIIESLVLGILGGLLGLGAGWVLGQGFNSIGIDWMPPGAIRPVPVELTLGLGNAWIPLLISAVATLLSALIPSIHSARIQIVDALRTN